MGHTNTTDGQTFARLWFNQLTCDSHPTTKVPRSKKTRKVWNTKDGHQNWTRRLHYTQDQEKLVIVPIYPLEQVPWQQDQLNAVGNTSTQHIWGKICYLFECRKWNPCRETTSTELSQLILLNRVQKPNCCDLSNNSLETVVQIKSLKPHASILRSKICWRTPQKEKLS